MGKRLRTEVARRKLARRLAREREEDLLRELVLPQNREALRDILRMRAEKPSAQARREVDEAEWEVLKARRKMQEAEAEAGRLRALMATIEHEIVAAKECGAPPLPPKKKRHAS